MTAPAESPSVSFWDDKPVLLLASLAALSVSVGCVWLMGVTGSGLAVLPAIVASIAGTGFVVHVINKQLDGDDNG